MVVAAVVVVIVDGATLVVVVVAGAAVVEMIVLRVTGVVDVVPMTVVGGPHLKCRRCRLGKLRSDEATALQ